MPRSHAVAVLLALIAPPAVNADAFDLYINPVLAKLVESPNVQEVKQLTPDLISDHDRVLPGQTTAFVIVKTNDGRYAKLLVQAARQKVGDDKFVPMLLVERYVTFKEGEEQTRLAEGRNVALFPNFRLSLDRGQVVPEEVGGDIRFVVGDKTYLEPLGKARLFVVTTAVADLAPKAGPKLVVGETFEPRYFNGTFKLYDDGRRSGKLVLKVDEEGLVTGSYYSDRDGQKYEVRGRTGTPKHSIQFTVQFPRTEQVFQGMLFTGDGAALTGTSRIDNRESGFYAVRVED
jgi:hypothetical protein